MTVTVHDRELFSEAEAARHLRVPPSTLHDWLEGGTRRGRTYKPIIRPEPRGVPSLTWAEFVEACLLREYRRTHNVPMAELRAFIDLLREKFGVPYPLADKRPYVAGREQVLEAQDESGLSAESCLVALVRGQTILTPPSSTFLKRVEWDGDLAVAWRPHEDPESTVRIAPDVRFGKPAVRGISTEVLWEAFEAGEDLDELAAAHDLSVRDVRWALAYENAIRAA